MQYFQAVQIGKQRANKAQMVLFDISGFAMLTLTTKKIDGKFVPVGEESFATVIKTDDGFVILLVDTDGFTKAQTKALEKEEAQKIFSKVLDSGITEFSGKEIKIWADTYPAVQDELK
jgi:translation elongation factor P/translation initiation factor 5A